ncbi:MAG: hypothetical protein V9F00_17225 [Nocardioides sp.]
MDFGDVLGSLEGKQFGDFGEIVELIQKNRGALEAVGRLPQFLEKFGDALGSAGEQAREAAVALVGEDGSAGVRASLADTSGALADITKALASGVDKIASAAESAAKVPLMDGPASRLAGAAEDMGATTERLGDLAKAMDEIGDVLAKVAAALAKLGDHLDDSGSQARGFAQLG